ncbi:MAG: NUDIX domain-containing protein [Bacilli bacterium]|nr:NUDIX domain-containing protein [Bacilli bacterium]
MQEEYFDILDEFGNKTGKIKSRSEVHRNGNFHKAVHIWIINDLREILLQRRCLTKDSDPNMLDISCAGHLTAGDTSIEGAIRELKEELNLDVKESDLEFIKTIKRCHVSNKTFIDNEYDDFYILRTDKSISDMKYQVEEISEIFFVPFLKFKEMIANKQPDLVIYEEEYEVLLDMFGE